MKKKILLSLACILTLTLTSCFKEPGAFSEFWQYVYIDTISNPVAFKGFYTGETYTRFENLRDPEQLEAFNLKDASLALVYMRFDIDASYKQTLTLLEGRKIEVYPTTSTMPTDSLQPVLGFSPIVEYENIWVNNGYMNICPTIPTEGTGKYYLIPEKVVNDTLFLSLAATYKEAPSNLREDLIFYDLRTLRDTTHADPELRTKMREMSTAIEQHRAGSMVIALTSRDIDYNFNYQGKDTIRTVQYWSNTFKCDF